MISEAVVRIFTKCDGLFQETEAPVKLCAPMPIEQLWNRLHVLIYDLQACGGEMIWEESWYTKFHNIVWLGL
jgi:hypothetical protein